MKKIITITKMLLVGCAMMMFVGCSNSNQTTSLMSVFTKENRDNIIVYYNLTGEQPVASNFTDIKMKEETVDSSSDEVTKDVAAKVEEQRLAILEALSGLKTLALEETEISEIDESCLELILKEKETNTMVYLYANGVVKIVTVKDRKAYTTDVASLIETVEKVEGSLTLINEMLASYYSGE